MLTLRSEFRHSSFFVGGGHGGVNVMRKNANSCSDVAGDLFRIACQKMDVDSLASEKVDGPDAVWFGLIGQEQSSDELPMESDEDA